MINGICEYFFSSNTKHNPAPKKKDDKALYVTYLLIIGVIVVEFIISII